MADDLSFAQPARRSFALPLAISILLLALVAVLLFRLLPQKTADVSVSRLSAYPSHVVFKSDSIVVGQDQAQDTMYVLATVRITDHLKLPLFLKDFTATLVPSDGGPLSPVSAVEKGDLATVFSTFPAVAKLAAAQGAPPLTRETEIQPGQTAEGWLLLSFPVSEKIWNERQAATISVDLYHQPALTVPIPKAAADPTPSQARRPGQHP